MKNTNKIRDSSCGFDHHRDSFLLASRPARREGLSYTSGSPAPNTTQGLRPKLITMPVIKLRITDASLTVQQILSRFEEMSGFDLTYWKREGDILAVFVTSETHVEFVMTADMRASLANEGMVVVKSEEYLANSTLIAKDLPRSLHDKSLEEIASDIGSCNEVSVTRVDWKGNDTLFIEFNTIEDAAKVLNSTDGMKLSYERSITQLKKKPFLKVPQCARCFSFEHESDSCPKTVRTCYHCGVEGHAGEECSTSYVRCANCQGDHVAFALKCPVRKQKEQEMKEDGYSPEDSVDGRVAASREEDEEESTRRAEEEISIILGVEKLRVEEPEDCQALHVSSSPTARSPEPDSKIGELSATPGVTDCRQTEGHLKEVTSGCPSQEESIQSPGASGRKGPQRSPRGTSAGKVEDPLPISPRRTSYPDRPHSRLGDPVSSPIIRPVPRKSPVKPSAVVQTGEVCGSIQQGTSSGVSQDVASVESPPRSRT